MIANWKGWGMRGESNGWMGGCWEGAHSLGPPSMRRGLLGGNCSQSLMVGLFLQMWLRMSRSERRKRRHNDLGLKLGGGSREREPLAV